MTKLDTSGLAECCLRHFAKHRSDGMLLYTCPTCFTVLVLEDDGIWHRLSRREQNDHLTEEPE